MRKLILTSASALALSAGAAFAGAPDPAKVGADVSAGNESTVEQIGSGNHVGTGASTGVDQQVMDNRSGNFSEVYQGNYDPTSSSNGATLQQKAAGGAKNASRVSQNNKNNVAQIQQNTDATNAGPASVIYSMPSFTFTDNHNSNIITGSGVSDPQAPGQFTSTLEQWGNNNQAYVNQGIWGGPAATGRAFSGIEQSDSSSVEVHQLGGANNWSVANQTNSSATVSQDGNLGFTNGSYLVQTAGANANISQQASAGNNLSSLDQTGGFAGITQVAYAGSNTAAAMQTGGVENVWQYAYGPGTNTSVSWQSGGNVSVTQDVYTAGGHNSSDITQTNGQATVYQYAYGGTNESTIRSNGGTSEVTQTARGAYTNDSSVNQSGINYAHVEQSQALGHDGDNTSTIDQTLTDPTKAQNWAKAVQTASFGPNTSHITQTGFGNVANVSQH